MSAGLCSVLKSIRGSMDSDSDSDNDHDVTDDVDPPSWHGSMQHLTSTSESEAGNCSSESFLCDHCGRHSGKGDNNSSNNSNHSRTSGRPPFPSGRKRGVRPKKRAHFAVDTDNSSDNADKMSDSHESSPGSTTFKPISGNGPSQLVLSTRRRGSLSPREIKPASSSDSHNTRPSSSFTRSNSLSTSSDRGRQPFKADHQLFKLPPSGSSAPSSSTSGKPALPPRQIHRNHFKLQRRNSISNEERGKLPLQPDGRPIRSASATREISGKSCDKDGLQIDARPTHQRVTFSPNDISSKNGDGFSAVAPKEKDNVRELPNYDEAVQRISLLRWASLQKLPSKPSGENQQSLSSGDNSPTKDRSPQTFTSTSIGSTANGYVGQRVRCFEKRAVSLISGSNSSSVTVDRLSQSWNPALRNNSNIRDHNSTDTEYSGDRLDRNVTSVVQSVSGGNGSVFRLRRDNSSTLSDDVFAHDDSRENFADISWSPVTPSEEKGAEKNTFLSVPPLPPKPSATARLLAPPLPISQRHTSTRDQNASRGSRHSGYNDRNNNNNDIDNVTNRNSVDADSGGSNARNHNSLGDNNNGKRIVLEVLV